MVGGFPRKEGMERKDVMTKNVSTYKSQASALEKHAAAKGTAEVVFSRRQDALSAVKRYNNVQLDGKPMKIEIVGTNVVTPGAGPPSTNGNIANFNEIPRRKTASTACLTILGIKFQRYVYGRQGTKL